MANIWDDLEKQALAVAKPEENIWDKLEKEAMGLGEKPQTGFISDIKRGTGQIISGVGSSLRDLGAEDTGAAIEAYGDKVIRRNPSQINTFEDVLDKPFTTGREAVGEVLPQIGGVVGGQVAGRVIGGALGIPFGPAGVAVGQQVGGFAGSLLTSAATTYGGIRSEQRETGQNDISRAIATAIPATALERFAGAERIAGKVVGKGTNFLARETGESVTGNLVRQGLRGGIEEAITEIPQTALERVGAFKDIASPEAFDEYGVAGVKAFIGGGAVRSGLSAFAGVRDQPGLAGTDQSPSNSAINRAIDNSNQDIPVGPPPQSAMTGPRLPEMVGPQITPEQVATQQAQQQVQQQQTLEAQAKAAQDQLNTVRQEVFTKYGGVQTTIPNGTKPMWVYQGKNYFTEESLGKALDAQVKKEAEKTPLVRAVETALTKTYEAVGIKPYSPGRMASFLAPFTEQAESLEEVANRIEAQLGTIKRDTPESDTLTALRNVILGLPVDQPFGDANPVVEETPAVKTAAKPAAQPAATAPAAQAPSPVVDVTQQYLAEQAANQEGDVNEQLQQVQPDAGIRAVSEQGGAAQASQGVVGDVRPDEVRPIGTGSNALLTDTQQDVGQGAVRARVEPSTSGQRDAISDDRQEALSQVRRIFTELFGSERDANIIMELQDDSNPKTQTEIAKKYGVNQSTVSRILKVLQSDTLGPRFFLAAKKLGYSKDEVASLIVAIEGEQEQDTDAEIVDDRTELLDRQADDALPNTNVDDINPAFSDEANVSRLGNEEVFGDEDSGATQGGFQIVDSIAGTKSADASSKNKTKAKYKENGTNWKEYEDFELQNLVADKIVKKADLPSLLEEVKRREAKRIGANNANEKSGAASVPVGEKTTTRKRVRKQDAEKQEAPAEDLNLTQEERAANAWDKVASQIEDAPLFQDLTEEQRQNFIDFGPDNWTAADVNTELNKIAADDTPKINFKRLVAEEKRDQAAEALAQKTNLTPEQINYLVNFDMDMTVEDVDLGLVDQDIFNTFPGVIEAKAKLEAAGVSNALNAVSDYVLFTQDGVEGIQTLAGTPSGNSASIVGINANILIGDADRAAFTLTHEIAHSIDDPGFGGVYSGQPEFNVRVTPDGKLPTSFMGSVMRELHELHRYDEDFKFLDYPFSDTDTIKNAEVLRSEVFAQMFAAMLDPQFRAMAKTKAPQTYAFMEDVFNDLKTTTFQTVTPEGREAQTIRRGAAFSDNRGQRAENARPVRPQNDFEGVIFASKGGNLYAMRQDTQTRIDRMPKAYRGTVQKMFDFLTTKNLGDRALAMFAFTRDVTERAAKAGLKAARTYQRLYDARKQVLGSYSSRIEAIIEDFNKLDSVLKGTGPNSVNRFIKDSTVDGKWGFQPDWLPKPVTVDPDMKARFDAIEKQSPKAAQIIKQVFKYNYDTNQAMKKAILDSISSEFDALIAQAKKDGDVIEEARLIKEKAKDITEFSTRLAIRNEKPYAALKRFGNIVIVGKSQAYMDAEDANDQAEIRKLQTDENHYVVRFAETNSEAQAIYRDMQGKFAYLTEPFDSAAAERSVYGGSDLNGVFYRLRNLVEKDDLDDPVQRGMVRMLNSLHLKLLSEESVRQSENRRKNITGADDDMMRAFVTQGRAAAHFVSSLTNSAGIYDAMREMRKERDARTPGKDVRSIYYNEIMKRHGMEMNYDPTPVVDGALSVTSTWMLLTSPGYFFQNATQPFLLSLPYMAANPKFGYNRTVSELLKSYGEVKNVIGIGKKGLSEADYKDLPADVRGAIEELVNRGSINISLSAELGRFRSDTGDNLDYVDKGQALYTKGTDMLRGMAENLESINRLTTAMTAYRMALKSGMSNEAAIDYADKVIYSTHGDYAGANAPRFMRTPVGRVATQFRKFQLIQISLLARMWHQWRQGATPEERIVARRQLMFTLGHTFAIGGMMGMPGFTALAFLFGALFGDEDEPDDPELTLRKLIGDKDLADLLLQGMPAFMGVNLSGKLGMGQMLSVLPYTDLKFTRDSLFEATAALAGGPFVGGVLPRAINGASYMASGDYYKGLEQLMPKGIGDAMKGVRFGTEGVTNKRGDLQLSADEVSFMDSFLSGLGLPTKTITDRQMLESSKFKFDEFYNGKTTELKNAYAKAYRANDTEAMADVREKWKKIQESRVKNGYSRQPLSTLLKAPMEQRKRERMTEGGVGYNKSNRRFVQQNSEV